MEGTREFEQEVATDAAPYNFGRSGQISNDQMRAIAMVNDGIARNLTHVLGAWLRSQVAVTLDASEQLTYAEFINALAQPTYLSTLRLEPLGGVGLLQLDLSLAMTVIDVLLGGRGVADLVREVTDIEKEILSSVLSVVMRELNAAWETVGLTFTLEEQESPEHALRLMPGTERMLAVSFDFMLQETQGKLKLCLPAVVLNTIHRRLIAVKEQPRRNFEASGVRVTELLGNATVRATLRLPTFRLSSRELQRLAPDYILPLQVPRTTRAELLACGVRIGAAVPVGRGDRCCALIDRRKHPRGPESAAVSRDADSVDPPQLAAPAVTEGELVA